MDASIRTEFSIYLAQRPGELAGVLDALSTVGVDLHAVCVVDQNSRGLVRLLGEPEERVREVFESLVEAGAGPVLETPVLAVSSENRPRLLRDVAAKLALAGVNVQHAYSGSAPGREGRGECVFRVSDLRQAVETIGSMT